MINLLLVAKNPDLVKKAHAWIIPSGANDAAFDLPAGKVLLHLNTLASQAFDAVLLYIDSASDFAELEKVIAPLAQVPIKFLLYDKVPANADFEKKILAKGITSASAPAELAGHLVAAEKELAEMIKKIFVDFDKDHSGFIELKEIVSMAKKLGVTIPEAEAHLLITELDDNKDGKISLGEFTSWWKSGRKGKNLSLSDLVSRKIKKDYMGIASKFLEDIAKEADVTEEGKKLVEVHLSGHVNKAKDLKTVINLHGCSKGKYLNLLMDSYTSGLDVKADKSQPFFAIVFGCKDPKAMYEKVKELIEFGKEFAGAIPPVEQALKMVTIDQGIVGNKVIVRVAATPAAGPLYAKPLKEIKKIPTIDVPDQVIDAYLTLKTTLGLLVTDMRPIVDQILEGVSLEFKGNLSRSLAKFVGGCRKEREVCGCAAKCFKVGKVSMEVEIGKEEIAEIHKAADNPIFNMPLGAFKEMILPEIIPMISSLPVFSDIHKIVMEQLQSLEIGCCYPELIGYKFHAELPGLDQFLKLE